MVKQSSVEPIVVYCARLSANGLMKLFGGQKPEVSHGFWGEANDGTYIQRKGAHGTRWVQCARGHFSFCAYLHCRMGTIYGPGQWYGKRSNRGRIAWSGSDGNANRHGFEAKRRDG